MSKVWFNAKLSYARGWRQVRGIGQVQNDSLVAKVSKSLCMSLFVPEGRFLSADF